jgi:hypothetical protein
MHLNCLVVDVAAMRSERDSAPATEAFYCIDFGAQGVFAGTVWLFYYRASLKIEVHDKMYGRQIRR